MKLEKSILEFEALRVNRNTIKMGARGETRQDYNSDRIERKSHKKGKVQSPFHAPGKPSQSPWSLHDRPDKLGAQPHS